MNDDDPTIFDIAAKFWEGDTLELYKLVIILDYMLRTSINQSKENDFLSKRQEGDDILQKL